MSTEKAAVRARETGKNVHADGTGKRAPTSSVARRVEEKATGKENTTRHDAHEKSDRPNSGDTNPHYQPIVREKGSEGLGHTTCRALGYGTAVGVLPTDAGPIDRSISGVVDLFNPVSNGQDIVGLFTGYGQE